MPIKKPVSTPIAVILLILLLSSITIVIWCFLLNTNTPPEIYIGVEFAYGDIEECKKLVDKVKNYTNLFVIGLPELTFNKTQLNDLCDYVYASGFHFIVMFTNPQSYRTYHPYVWIKKAAEKYGEKFLGVYYYDEPGGKQLDGGEGRMVVEAENISDAARIYVDYLRGHIEYYLYSGVNLFSSDYGLYWFDYKAGYDVILTQFGWNHSRLLHVALCRGAANAYSKDWGVIITWEFMQSPYIESGDALYNDLVLAYKSGAKYFVIFNYPNITSYGILTEEHFEALKSFWEYVQRNPKEHGVYKGEVCYVLPKDYGFGFREPEDTIWGLWENGELAEEIWMDVQGLLEEYQLKLDIIYDDECGELNYKQVIFWND